jgi:hypothetical protein
MRFRKLRIAFSAMCLIACVLLIVLWVRSYWYWDNLDNNAARSIDSHSIDSLSGYLLLDEQISVPVPNWMERSRSGSLLGTSIEWSTLSADGATARGIGTAIPDWLPVLVAAVFAIIPWLRWRFSLRTLLIATTLVAAVLGLIVYALK